jgi:hypothetical protein
MTETNNTTDEFFDDGDFAFIEKTGEDGQKEIVGGGYKIKSFFLQSGTPAMTTYNKMEQSGGNVSSPFENLAVPAGLFYVNMRLPKKEHERNPEEHYKGHITAPDEMIDKLYALVEVDKKRKRKTKKQRHKLDKTKTRKHK